MTKQQTTSFRRAAALLLGLGLTAAACGGGSTGDEASERSVETTAVASAGLAEGESAMEDGDAMAEDDAMADDEAMQDDDTMEDSDTMEDDDAMSDGDAMEDDDAMSDEASLLEVAFSGLEPLGSDFDYEAWTIVDGEPVTGGRFDIGDDGSINITSDGDHLYGHENASAVVITIEPEEGDDPAPADTHVLAADVAEDGSFALSIGHPAALGTDFSDANGSFLLATPTNDPDADELSGVWFLNIPGPEASLDLPTLPAGWAYEGWVVIDGQPVTTGRFLTAAGADDFDGFSGPNDGPTYPGEDFIINAPEGLTFPTDLTGATVVVSVEPDADNSPAPFALKPLIGEAPAGIGDHESVDLSAGPVAISGTGRIVS